MSISRAPLGIVTVPLAPTAVMRLSVTTTSPRSITSVPCIVISRAFRSTTTPRGLSFVAVIVTSNRRASYARLGVRVVSRGAPAGAGAALVMESARDTESRIATSAVRTSYWNQLRPIE